VHERGATIKALDRQFLHLSTTIGKGILAILSALAQDERERILKRSKEVMWLLGRLVPDHKTIADFRKDSGGAIKKVCARFGRGSATLIVLSPGLEELNAIERV